MTDTRLRLYPGVQEHLDTAAAMQPPMRRNFYTCQACGGRIVTRDRDIGVTPFTIQCRATKGCPGTMYSSMYRVSPDVGPVTFEWFRPRDVHGLDGSAIEHLRLGGLIMAEIDPFEVMREEVALAELAKDPMLRPKKQLMSPAPERHTAPNRHERRRARKTGSY